MGIFLLIFLPVLAADSDETNWGSLIVTLVILMFIFIGPIIKAITKGTRDKVAKNRGVEELPEDESKPEPASPPELAQTVMDEIAEAVQKKKDEREAKRRAEAAAPKPISLDEFMVRNPKSDVSSEENKIIVRTTVRQAAERTAEASQPSADVYKYRPKQKGKPAESRSYLPPVPVNAVKAVQPVVALEGVKEHVDKKRANILDLLPERLTLNQKALILSDILGNPKVTEADAPRLWEI